MKQNNSIIYPILTKYILNMCPEFTYKAIYNKNQKNIYVYTFSKYIYFFFFILKNHFNFNFKSISDFTASDYPELKNRFNLIYIVNSFTFNTNIIVKSWINEFNLVDSLSNLYAGLNWSEREVWDMYGIQFENHPDLRRILTDYGFNGFPLRKDFPLSGFIELRYYDKYKKIIYSPIKLIQEFRKYDLQSPWNYYDLNFKS